MVSDSGIWYPHDGVLSPFEGLGESSALPLLHRSRAPIWRPDWRPPIAAQSDDIDLSQLASYRLQEERLKVARENLQRVGYIERKELARRAQAYAEAYRGLWKDGIEPMPIDEFCWRLDGSHLFPRQSRILQECGLLRAADWLNPNKRLMEVVLCHGKGCMRGDTLLTCYDRKETRPMQEWAEMACPVYVKSWDEKAQRTVYRWASPVYKKGVDDFLTVTLADGRQFTATPKHRCLTPEGWKEVGALTEADQLLCLPPPSSRRRVGSRTCRRAGRWQVRSRAESVSWSSQRSTGRSSQVPRPQCDAYDSNVLTCETSSNHSRRVLGAYALPARRKAVSFRSDCHPSHRLCDGPPLRVTSTGPGAAPSRTCALSRTRDSWHAGAPAFAKERIRSYQVCVQVLKPSSRGGSRDRTPGVRTQGVGLAPRPHGIGHAKWTQKRQRRVRPRPSSRHSNTSLLQSQEPNAFSLSTSGHYVSQVTCVCNAGRGDYYDLTVGGTHCYYDSSSLVIHHNSGKDYLIAKCGAYFCYIVNNIRGNIARFFGRASSTHIAAMNVAPNEELAKTVFFKYLKAFMTTDIMKPYVTSPQSQILTDRIDFPEIGFTFYSKHSRASGLEGQNLIFSVMDEADDFITANDISSASQIESILRTSASTRFGNRWLLFVISYPRTEDGFMMNLIETAKKEHIFNGGSYYYDIAATWDVNPLVDRNSEAILADYRHEPTLSAAKYECRPAPTSFAYFEDPQLIDRAINETREPAIVWSDPFIIERPVTENGQEVMRPFMTARIEKINKQPGMRYFAGIDNGQVQDSWAFACVGIDETQRAADWVCPRCSSIPGVLDIAEYRRVGTAEDPWVVPVIANSTPQCGVCYTSAHHIDVRPQVLDLNGWWLRADLSDGRPGKSERVLIDGRPVEIPSVKEVSICEVPPRRQMRDVARAEVDFIGLTQEVHRACKELEIQILGCDPWQATYMMQTLGSSTNTEVRPSKMSNTDQLQRAGLCKILLAARLFEMIGYKNADGVDTRTPQWKRLQKKGNRIDHPAASTGGKKDIYDAEAIAVWLAVTYTVGEINLSVA